MIPRPYYMERLIQLRGTALIKVITGVRRCGKSTLLDLYRDYLQNQGVEPGRIIAINFEDLAKESLLEYHALYRHIAARLSPKGRTYIFLDEIQQVRNFEKALDSLYIKKNTDIYITGSNAYLLSGEMATLLSGRYIEINMLPLSFKEWYGAEGGDKRDAFNRFFRFGGFPYALNIKDQRTRRDYIQGIYNTILLKDVVRRKHIGDAELLERLCLFLFDNIGSLVSTKKIADSINTQGRRASPVTIEGYIGALLDAYLFYRASRYDVKGKKYLKSLEKYYLVDMGFRNLLPAGQNQDRGYMLENIVYLELARRGWTVHLGKAGEREIDFVARRHEELRYYQVAATALENTVLEREMLPLRTVKDNYPKFLLTLDDLPLDREGIIHKNIIDFLLE